MIVALVREVGALVVLRALGRTVREGDSRGPVLIALESDLVQVPGPPAFDTLLPIQQRDGGASLVGVGRVSLGRLNCPQLCAALARRAVIVALVREVGALVVLRALGRTARERESRALESDFIAAIWGPAFDTLLPIQQREEALGWRPGSLRGHDCARGVRHLLRHRGEHQAAACRRVIVGRALVGVPLRSGRAVCQVGGPQQDRHDVGRARRQENHAHHPSHGSGGCWPTQRAHTHPNQPRFAVSNSKQ